MSKKSTPFQQDRGGGEDTALASSGASDFAALFEQSQGVRQRPQVGDVVRGEVLAVGSEEIFIGTGGPIDAVIPRKDLGESPPKVGDFIEARVMRSSESEILLRPLSATSTVSVDSLEDAFEMELPVEGTVVEVVKGGFRVKLLGLTAFCPMSQMDAKPIKDPAEYLNKKFEFTVTKLEPPRDVVLSRRKLLSLQRAETEGQFLKEFKAGDFVDGEVTRLEPFGAFVELRPQVEALVHISELSWDRVRNPQEAVAVGQRVNVRILKIDESEERLKISVSLKQGRGQVDPWTRISEDFPRGRILEGRIEKRESFGFFVHLGPGVTGLLPKSRFRDGLTSVENKRVGDGISVQITEVKPEERRITLGLPTEESDAADWSHALGAKAEKSLGTLGDLFKNFKK
ncbi:MAG: 30S ribosomal protein S1 [Bdellovibrio sp.]|nr:MAG: 30S ribosomal protein S1 [Bdellovibrio sp.]